MAGQSVGELFVELFFKADTIKLNDFLNSVGELNMASIASSLGLAGLYNGMEKILSASSETAIGLHTFGAETGLSTEKVDQFDNATRKAGLGAEVFKNAVESMQDKITQMRLTGGDSGFFSSVLGLNPYEAIDAIDMVEKAITRVKEKFPPNMRRWAMQQIGLPPSLLAVDLTKVREEQFQKSEQTQKLMDYVTAMTDLKIALESLRDVIAVFIAPFISMVAGVISNILKIGEHVDTIAGDNTLLKESFQNLAPIGMGGGMLTSGGNTTTIKNDFHILSTDPKEAARATYEEMKRLDYDAAHYQSGAVR